MFSSFAYVQMVPGAETAPAYFDDFLTAILTAANILVVFAIYSQIKTEKEHLENFDPSIKVVSASSVNFQQRDGDGAIKLNLRILNTSQTVVYVSEIWGENPETYLAPKEEYSANGKTVLRMANDYRIGEGELEKSIVVPPNQSVDVEFILYSEELSGSLILSESTIEELVDGGKVNLMLKGNFRETEMFNFNIPEGILNSLQKAKGESENT